MKNDNKNTLPVTSYPVAVVAEINTLNLMENSLVEDLKLEPSKKYSLYFYIV